MRDPEVVLELLSQIHEAAERIRQRAETILRRKIMSTMMKVFCV